MLASVRHPSIPTQQVALSEELRQEQIRRGFYIEKEGIKYALPIDSWADRSTFLGVKMWEMGGQFPHRIGAKATGPGTEWQGKLLTWLRDNVHKDIPARYYNAVLGHDLHVSFRGELFAKHWHVGWASPFDPGDGSSIRGAIDSTFDTYIRTHWPEDGKPHRTFCRLGHQCPAWTETPEQALERLQQNLGFIENLGWISSAKVTDAFVSEIIDELVSATGSEFADFDSHEVGTSTQAENNNDTALITTTGIARAAGTPTDADPIYRSVATITADTSETWQEHGIFNNTSGAALMDRNLTGGQAVVSSDQVQYTYELTVNPEA